MIIINIIGIQYDKVKRHCFGVWSVQIKSYPNFKLLVRFSLLVVEQNELPINYPVPRFSISQSEDVSAVLISVSAISPVSTHRPNMIKIS